MVGFQKEEQTWTLPSNWDARLNYGWVYPQAIKRGMLENTLFSSMISQL